MSTRLPLGSPRRTPTFIRSPLKYSAAFSRVSRSFCQSSWKASCAEPDRDRRPALVDTGVGNLKRRHRLPASPDVTDRVVPLRRDAPFVPRPPPCPDCAASSARAYIGWRARPDGIDFRASRAWSGRPMTTPKRPLACHGCWIHDSASGTTISGSSTSPLVASRGRVESSIWSRNSASLPRPRPSAGRASPDRSAARWLPWLRPATPVRHRDTVDQRIS